MPAPLAAWQQRGRQVEVGGHHLFALEAGDRASRSAILLLHGFPSFSFDFHRVLPRLAARHHVVVHDHLGFGLSDKPAAASYSLLDQADRALALWSRLGVGRAHLVGHDYGTSVATEVLARRERGGLPFEIASVTLSNGSVLLELARLRLAQRLLRSRRVGPLFARIAGRRFFTARMRALWGDRARAGPDDLATLWAGLEHQDGRKRLPVISGYLAERVRFRDRWLGPLTRLDRPLNLVWGDRDPVAVHEIARRLAAASPVARLTWLPGVGHYPMLEAPRHWAEAVLAGLPA